MRTRQILASMILFIAVRLLFNKNIMDKIGLWMGEKISEMSLPRLLEFAAWAVQRIESLQNMADVHHDLDLKRETLKALS